jgi:PD-(D/E)XK nuclease superfamily
MKITIHNEPTLKSAPLHLLPPVENKVPRVSFSQVQTFLRCRLKWRYGYVLGLVPLEPDKAMEMGSYLHGKLDIYYQLYRQTREPEELWGLMEPLLLEDLDLKGGTNGEMISRSMKVMWRYIHEFSPQVDAGIELIESEMHFEAPLTTPKGRDFLLEGYVDLLYSHNGQIRVRDHKTTGKAGNFRKKGDTDYDMQQATYIGGLRTVGIPVFRGEVTELITFNYSKYSAEPLDKLMRRTPTYRTDRAIEAAMRWYGRVVDQMIDENEFLPSRESGCRYCWYRDPCTLLQEGVDDAPVLSVGFRNKTYDVPSN